MTLGFLGPEDSDKVLSVGELASRSGLPVSTIHFYESKGLIQSWRNAGNHRRYPRGILRHVAIIKVAQRTGIPLAEVKRVLSALPRGRAPGASDWRRMSASWKQELDKRIERLTALRDQLNECIGCGCLSLESCPLRNPEDALGERGTGPVLIDPE